MNLLKQLSTTPAVPGREQRMHQLITEQIQDHVDDIRIDAMGSLIAVRKARGGGGRRTPLRVMLAAHMDQIGFLVSHVDEESGYLRVNPVGGFDVRNLFSRRVKVCTAKADWSGVLNPAGKPVHIASEEERKRIPQISELYIDLARKPAAVKRAVKVGDMVVFDAPCDRIGDAMVGPALDNRIGCWAQIRALQNLGRHACEIHAVWTVQEEVGLRGAGPAAFGIEPDIGLSCDTTLCCQAPGITPDQHVTRSGEGVCLKIMDSSTIADLGLLEQIETVAAQKKIHCQRGILPRGGQDGAMIQRSRTGVRTAVFACPVKFIHTATEMAAVTDIEAYRDLLRAYLKTL